MRASTLRYFHGLISSQTFRRALTAWLDSAQDIGVPGGWRNQFCLSVVKGGRKLSLECDWTGASRPGYLVKYIGIAAITAQI